MPTLKNSAPLVARLHSAHSALAPGEAPFYPARTRCVLPTEPPITTPITDESSELTPWTRAKYTAEIPEGSNLSVGFSPNRCGFLTKESVVVAWWEERGVYSLLPDSGTNPFGISREMTHKLWVPLIDCTTLTSGDLTSNFDYLGSG